MRAASLRGVAIDRLEDNDPCSLTIGEDRKIDRRAIYGGTGLRDQPKTEGLEHQKKFDPVRSGPSFEQSNADLSEA